MGIIRWLRRLIYVGLAVFAATAVLVTASAHWMLSEYPANRDFGGKLDVVVVLGSGIEPDGILSYSSRRRVRTAVRMLQAGATDRIILSGGPVAPKLFIADFMKDFAVEIGGDPNTLLVETSSRTTWENLRFVYPMLDDPEIRRIGLLTDPSHLGRALVLNEYLDGPKVIPIAAWGQLKSPRTQLIIEFGRETMAWWYNLGKIAAWQISGWAGYSEEERAKLIF